MTNALDLAYCAGLFDGEGCVSVSSYMTDTGRSRFHCDLVIGMQNYSALELIKNTVETGSINRRSDCWVYQASGAKAVSVAKKLLPYLRVKREAVALFIEFAATFNPHGPKPTPTDVVEKRHILSQRIRAVMKADALSFRSDVMLAELREEN